MTEVGIDTSVLIGLLDPKDIWHDTATTLKKALQTHQFNNGLIAPSPHRFANQTRYACTRS
jgi:predicted nucleic acid-binding protein